MIKYLLSIFLLVLSVKFSKQYIKEEKERLEISAELLRFMKFVKDKITLSLMPISKIALCFSSERLCGNGFLDAVSKGEKVSEAFKKTFGKEGADRDFYEVFCSSFDKIGESNLEDELKRLDVGIERLEERVEQIREEHKKTAKIVTTLSLAFALGIIILLL